jgi:hypothetical protein
VLELLSDLRIGRIVDIETVGATGSPALLDSPEETIQQKRTRFRAEVFSGTIPD